jgi:hyperosmotically inducible protein
LAGEGEVFVKEDGQQVQKDFAKACYTDRIKGLVMNYFTIKLTGVTTMKKSYSVIRFLVVLMMIAAFVACAWIPKPESPGEYVDDSVITTKVKALLAEDDLLKSFKISVKTYQGTVHLSGLVASQNAVDKAGQIAWSVKGVTSVRNDLLVK